MNRILPVLTVTALAAAASAQTAPAPAAKQSLSYNRIIVSYLTTNDSAIDNGVSFFAQAKIGGGFYVAASVLDFSGAGSPTATVAGAGSGGGPDGAQAALGWAYTLPSFIGVTTDVNVEFGYKSVGVGIRALIGGGVELGVSQTHGAGSSAILEGEDTFAVSASYNLGFLVKGLSVNGSYSSLSGRLGPDITSVGIGYNF